MSFPTVDEILAKQRPCEQLPETINKDIAAYIEARIDERLARFAHKYELSLRRRLGGTVEP